MSDFSVVAIIAAYNEADIIEQVVRDLIDQGIQVYLLDDGSTDGTVTAVDKYRGRGLLDVEQLSNAVGGDARAGFDWQRILLRKAQLARQLDANWYIHHDADEFRESPWSHYSLKDAIQQVDALGFNAIDFASLDFWPVHDRFRTGDDVRKAFTLYSPRASYDRLQIRCWKKTADLVDLSSSGGHDVRFPGRKVFPIRFILRHYPIRGQAHGERKVFEERRKRFRDEERALGWHVQYDGIPEGASFIHDPSTLTPYDPDAVRLALTLRHRDVEALETSLEDARKAIAQLEGDLARHDEELTRTRSELSAVAAEAATLRRDLESRTTELSAAHAELASQRAQSAGLQRGLDERMSEIRGWRAVVEDGTRRIDAFERSLSWRWTAPARAAFRLLRGGR
jgi:hypothetical protein